MPIRITEISTAMSATTDTALTKTLAAVVTRNRRIGGMMEYLDLKQFTAIELPRFLRVKQHFEKTHVDDIAEEIKTRLAPHLIQVRGKRIAIGIGSRGIANLTEISKSLVVELDAAEAEPFIV